MSTESEVDEKELEQLCFNIANCGSCESGGQCSYHNDEIRNLITRREQEAEARGRKAVFDEYKSYKPALCDRCNDYMCITPSIQGVWTEYCRNCDRSIVNHHPTSADSLNLSKSKGLKPAKDFDPSQVTLCPSCNQMTHTIMSDTKGDEDYCGKCGKVKLDEPQTRDFAAEAKQVEKILNRPHEPDYQCTQCSKSPAEHTTAGAGDTPTKTEN